MLWGWQVIPPAPADWVDSAIRLGERFGVAFIFSVVLSIVLWKVVNKQNTAMEKIADTHAKTIEALQETCANEREEIFKRLDAHQVSYIQREAERSKESAAREQRAAEVFHQTLDKILQKVAT